VPVPAPYPLAMVVCDTVWRDPYTGKFTIIGTFSAIGGESFPLIHPIFSVYIALTDGHGKVPILLELVDVNEESDSIFSFQQEFEFQDPRIVCEIVFAHANVLIPKAGEYRLKLFASNEFILERRILALGPPEEEQL